MAKCSYTVPGLIVPLRQPSASSCWAAVYAMMYSWVRQQTMDIRAAVALLGPRYLRFYDSDTGLPVDDNRNLPRTAGLKVEGLFNLNPDGLEALLRKYGLLWTSFGGPVVDATSLAEAGEGRHIVVVFGIEGDGSTIGTKVRYIDPGDGRVHEIPFDKMVKQTEGGAPIRRITDRPLPHVAHVMHY